MNLFARVNNNEVIYEIVAAAAAVRWHVFVLIETLCHIWMAENDFRSVTSYAV